MRMTTKICFPTSDCQFHYKKGKKKHQLVSTSRSFRQTDRQRHYEMCLQRWTLRESNRSLLCGVSVIVEKACSVWVRGLDPPAALAFPLQVRASRRKEGMKKGKRRKKGRICAGCCDCWHLCLGHEWCVADPMSNSDNLRCAGGCLRSVCPGWRNGMHLCRARGCVCKSQSVADGVHGSPPGP